MYSLVLVGCGGAGVKFLNHVRRFVTVPAYSINESSADIKVERHLAEMVDSVHGTMVYEVYPWLKLIRGENVIVMSGLGGVTGTGIAKLIGRALKKNSTLYGIFAEPFSMESPERRRVSEEAKSVLEENYHTLFYLPNDALVKYYPNLSIKDVLEVHPVVIQHLIQDFQRVIMKNTMNIELRGVLGLGIGFGVGKERIRIAIEDALDSPWHVGEVRYAFISGNVDREDVEIVAREYGFDFWDFYRTQEYGERVKVTAISK